MTAALGVQDNLPDCPDYPNHLFVLGNKEQSFSPPPLLAGCLPGHQVPLRAAEVLLLGETGLFTPHCWLCKARELQPITVIEP